MNQLRWLAITTTYIVLLIVAQYSSNYFSDLFAGDSTFTSTVIACLFVLGVILSYFYSKEDKPNFAKVFRLANICTMLGLLGSIIGFAHTFSGFNLAEIDAGNQEQIKNMMGSVATGIPIALNTTILGIYSSLALIAYPFFIKKGNSNGQNGIH